MSEFMIGQINLAHNLINEGMYDDAVEILRNIKCRIMDQSIKNNINEKEKEIEQDYSQREAGVTGKPTEIFTIVTRLKKERSRKYLTLYNYIVNEHDL